MANQTRVRNHGGSPFSFLCYAALGQGTGDAPVSVHRTRDVFTVHLSIKPAR